MEEMAETASAAVRKEQDMKRDLDGYKAKWDTDITVCKEALADLVDTIGPDTASRWRVTGLPEFDGSAFDPRDVYNLVCASKEALNKSRAMPDEPAAKRKRTAFASETAGSAAPAAARAAPVSNSLRAALASTFNASV